MKKILSFFTLFPWTVAAQTTLPEVVVTATRTAQTANEALASVTVITREELERHASLTLPEVLRGVAGLDLAHYGGIGQPTSLFMRGTNSDHVLVLIDGVKIGSPTLALAPFPHLPLSHIDRIEIVRGPRSSLYGSEAVGGVIQIFTRRGTQEPSFHGSAGVGSDQTYQVTAGLSGTEKQTWYSAQVENIQSHGFNACQGFGGCFTVEPDEDGYDNTSVGLHIGHEFSQQWQIEGHFLRIKGNFQYDSSFNNQTDFVQQVVGLKTRYLPHEMWEMTFEVGENRDKQESFGRSEFPHDLYDTKRTTWSWQNNVFLSNAQELTVGYDQQNDEVDSSIAYTLTDRENRAYFAQYQYQTDTREFSFGAHQEDNEQFGKHTTYHLALGTVLSPSIRSFISYGTAFKAPSFNQLYYPDYGNPQLDPEESKSFEIGLKGTEMDSLWSISAYRTHIDQLIATQFDASTGRFFADNIAQAQLTGAEAEINWHRDAWEVNTELTWLQAKDDQTGQRLPRRAEKTLKFELAHARGAARLGLICLTQGLRYDDAQNTRPLGGYTLVHLEGKYQFNKKWFVQTHVENIFDKAYETVASFNAPGRTWFLSVHYQP